MASSATIVLALLTVAASHPDGQEADRRLTWVHDHHIWGGSGQCSSHLSDGPADADVEIHLGGLPTSNASEEVHLQWWSARKSPTLYDPLASALNCSVHADVIRAYPRYSDADFNGGNVKVTASGEAVIRIRAPSTYFMWQFIATPHIHLRVCKGASNFEAPSDAVMMNGPDVWVSSARTTPVRVISARPYAASRAPSSQSASGPRPVAIIIGVIRAQSGSSTLPETTTTVPFTTTPMPAASSQLGVMIQAARDALDLDALEFSPVYSCLLQQQFFDHFSAGCAGACPRSAAVAHGQCVREETPEPQAQLQASWQLGIQCGNPCWHNRKKVTLHNVRLSFAGHLDIPFQEVEVSTGFSVSNGRRLSGTRTAHLTIKVTSNRISAAEGNVLLDSFAADAASLSTLLGLDVRTVTRGSAPNQQIDNTVMGQNNDPYGPAYSALENIPGTGGASSGVVGLLPTEAIIGIAVGLVALAGLALGLLWRRRRQRRAAAQARQAKSIDEKIAETEANSVPEASKPAAV